MVVSVIISGTDGGGGGGGGVCVVVRVVDPVVHVEAPAAENLPASQMSHSVLTPAEALNLPASHIEQASEPKDALYFPAEQATHTLPSGPVYPLLHTQLLARELPGGDDEADGQSTQAEEFK